MMSTLITGWDIGGAHLKVARCDVQGNLVAVLQLPCPLWKGIEYLQQAIQSVHQQLNNQNDLAAITMTGELVDIFPNRESGVNQILDCLNGFIDDDNISVYAGNHGWLTLSHAKQQWQDIASQNWQASANFTASKMNTGLFIDIGSTTCDIIAIKQGAAQASGYSDFQRQASRELLYTGAIRTPLIALTNHAPFNGIDIGLAAEVFATTGDCWCLLGYLDPKSIQDTSSDGKPWQAAYCINRIARLLGTDANQATKSHWLQLAQWFTEKQTQLVTDAILQVLSSHPDLAADAPIIGAGIGRFIAKTCAQRLNRPYQDFHDLIDSANTDISDHAPAVAISLLAQQQLS
ncbi:MAG: H4MPT-linked C1 transfer pathway protein [Piscirickettsiaceae bacterium]|nr:H4MPT-linked C1 transfer pathway protein [Piscirickettsiaceae bacterium]